VTAKARLQEIKGKSTSCVKRSLMMNADKADGLLLTEITHKWAAHVKSEKKDREDTSKFEMEVAHLECLQRDQKATAKKNLMRMTGDSDSSLLTMTFTAWAKGKEEERKQKDFEEREAKLLADLAKMKSGAKGGNKGVLQRVSEKSASGLLGSMLVNWRDHTKTEVRARDLERTMQEHEGKFKSLNNKQKGNAMHAAQNALDIQEDNDMMHIFMNWRMEVEIKRVTSHYKGKGKPEPTTKTLEDGTVVAGPINDVSQIYDMFKGFSKQLESTVTTTPRTEKKPRSSKPPAGPN